MRIRSINVRNYKNLRDVKLEDVSDLTVLIGRNSSGKTNLLEILNRFFSEIDLTGVPSGIDNYSWFDGEVENPIEVTVTVKFDEKECEALFPTDILKLIKDKFGEKSQEITICRQIVKPPIGWQPKSIKWAELFLQRDGKIVTPEDITKSISVPPLKLTVVFFSAGASKENVTGDRIVLVDPVKKAYLTGPYTDELVRTGKIEWINVSDKTTDWRKYAADQGCALVERELTQVEFQSLSTPIRPEVIQTVVSNIIARVKGRFKFILAVRDAWPQNPLARASLLDGENQNFLRDLGTRDDRTYQKRWSKVKEFFNKLSGDELAVHPSYLCAYEGDLRIPIQHIGGGSQELLFLLRHLTEDGLIFGIEEPESHLHPQLARQLFDILKQISTEKQVFITTHSTVFVDQADPANTWIVRKKNREAQILRVKEPEDLRNILYELGVKPSDIFYSNGIIFVEGTTEKVVLPILAEKIGVSFKSLEISLIPTYGKSSGRYHLTVWTDVAKNVNIPYFMILDKGAEKEAKKFVEKGILRINDNLFILKKGSIEEYYPKDRLIEAIKSEYNVEISDEEKERIPRNPCENVQKFLEGKNIDPTGWKVVLGRRVAEIMTVDEIEEEIKAIIERIATKLRVL